MSQAEKEMPSVRPTGGWVLIKPAPKKEATSAGIIIPSSATEYGHTVGTVIRANSQYYTRDKGVLVDMPVKSDDRVMYRDYLKDLEIITIEGEQHCFIYIDDIILILEDEHARSVI